MICRVTVYGRRRGWAVAENADGELLVRVLPFLLSAWHERRNVKPGWRR